jgi:hypothetical protein
MSNLVRPTLARRFVTISQKFHESQNGLLQRHNFDKDHDARVTIFSNCIVAISRLVTIAMMIRIGKNMEDIFLARFASYNIFIQNFVYLVPYGFVMLSKSN